MRKLRFAIIGCGQIAQRHAEHINNVGKLQAVCDVIIDRAWNLQEKYGGDEVVKDIMACSCIDTLLKYGKRIDVVSVCTPNYLHAEHAIKALQAGCHVLCEKPMALSVGDCRRMIAEAKKANKRLLVVKQNRFNPPIQKVKQMIDEDKLGTIFSIQLNCFWNRNPGYYRDSDWRGKKSMDGGTLFTQYSHFIDLLHWMIGDVREVYAMSDNFAHRDAIEFEDTGVVILRFDSGALGTINYTVNTHSKNMEGSLTIFGSKGTVKIGGQYLNELEYQDIEGYEIKDLPKGNPANDYGKYIGSMSNHDKVYENVVDVLMNGAEMSANGNDGLKAVEIISRIYHRSLVAGDKEDKIG